MIINIDDLGYADSGPFGSNNPTPNLDRMAKEGRKLMSHYAAPVCSPSRTALLTGCYAKRALPIPHVLFPVSAVGLNPDEVTIAEVLKGAGYATACVGKWHLGDQPAFLPTRQGFDQFFGIPYSNDMGLASEGAKSSADQRLPEQQEMPANLRDAAGKGKNKDQQETGITGANQPPLPLLDGDQVIERVKVEEQSSLTRRYTERAVNFIRDSKDKPFFLYLAHHAVHWPYHPSKQFRGKSPNGLQGDMVLEVDWSVGQVLDTLRELKLDTNTVVIFTSDNGGPGNAATANKPLRGSKGSTLEGGMRTCTIAWWPGKIPADTMTDAMTSMMDVLPTFTKLAAAKLPAARLDGVDIWPILAGDPAAPPRDTFHYFNGLTLEAVRSGPWKLQLSNGHLYNLRDDIGESRNVAADHPDVLERLRALADGMRGDLGLQGIGPGCRPLGRVAAPQPLIDHDGTVNPDTAGEKIRLE